MKKHVANTPERIEHAGSYRQTPWNETVSIAAHLYQKTDTERVEQDLVRQLIRRKLLERRLPRGRASDIWALLGEGQACDACGEPIVAKQQAVWAIATQDWVSVHFHAVCYDLWEAERLALARQGGDGQGKPPTPESHPR